MYEIVIDFYQLYDKIWFYLHEYMINHVFFGQIHKIRWYDKIWLFTW
jgi:hypothetical protein